MDGDSIMNSHLLPLSFDDDNVDQKSDSDSISVDSDIEVNDTNYINDDFIRLNLEHDNNSSEDEIESSITTTNNIIIPITDVQSFSTNINNINPSIQVSSSSNKDATTISVHQKRRQWNAQEKLKIISELNKGVSLHALELRYKCTRKMIRDWKNNENKLIKLVKDQGGKGKKRKRLDGGGAKLSYANLDDRLIRWYRSKRGLNQADVNVSKEKVTFKGMVREGYRICSELKTNQPSNKWFTRFLKRHRLSLQKPVRKQKISLSEAHISINKFHSYLRKCSQWGPKRGPMGCFVESDICNMDESPLSLWGDQSRRSINDINTRNEIEGCFENKRFATIMLCVFPERNHRVEPVLLFRGTGKVSSSEEKHYSPNVKVFFTPKAFINMPTLEKYITWWLKKVKDGNRKLFITDSCTSHLNENLKKRMRDEGISMAIIPTGCTQYIQLLDVHVFATFKNHYYDCAEEYLELNGPRSKLKLSASKKRILCTRLTASAWARTLKSTNFPEAFRSLGYTWVDDSLIKPNHIPWYTFDPDCIELNEDEVNEQNCDSVPSEHNSSILTKNQHKQLTLKHFWKK
ncbi:unnamed protein product [Rotaria sp. Silwood1]|nr:unnamed protein product [Rotaria sp. Silwood1]CAF1325466.1 unnamed protein product [Rotaria sp. Silwood1]CAF3519488.1 unnamed protein product [Rotaria sp. Silwood1]CAF3545011.1 unnamed protein product [Rotaria sp. Silwood1]CAF3572435.1 unnamed protein product [Rotaria sp. Silwood1]